MLSGGGGGGGEKGGNPEVRGRKVKVYWNGKDTEGKQYSQGGGNREKKDKISQHCVIKFTIEKAQRDGNHNGRDGNQDGTRYRTFRPPVPFPNKGLEIICQREGMKLMAQFSEHQLFNKSKTERQGATLLRREICKKLERDRRGNIERFPCLALYLEIVLVRKY